MPIYEYQCESCADIFESMRSMASRDEPAPCPKCGGEGKQQLSAFGWKYEGHYYGGGRREPKRTDPHD